MEAGETTSPMKFAFDQIKSTIGTLGAKYTQKHSFNILGINPTKKIYWTPKVIIQTPFEQYWAPTPYPL